MSLRPGIGALAVPFVAESLNDTHGAALVAREGDVPTQLRHGKRLLPLGRYLSRRLRDAMGFDDLRAQGKRLEEYEKELQALRAASQTRSLYEIGQPFLERQKMAQEENRAKIWRKKGSI